MPAAPPRKAGRPRASGAVAEVLGFELTSAEATPYRAGFRIGTASGMTTKSRPMTIADLSPSLRPHERAALAADTDAHFLAWFHVGVMAADLARIIKMGKEL